MRYRIDDPPLSITWNGIEVPQDMILFCHGIAKLRWVYMRLKMGRKILIRFRLKKLLEKL
jgi:hypothetical protein